MIKQILPVFSSASYKGQNGRLAIIGGCLEYTGAPFYSSISQLKGGADLAHIFCTKQAAIPIKSYSPEIITHPYLVSKSEDETTESLSIQQIEVKTQKTVRQVEEWQAALHSFVIGPGLGRDEWIESYIGDIIERLTKSQTIVLDADGLWYFINDFQKLGDSSKIYKSIIQNEPWNHILTPNQVEFERLWSCFMPNQQQISRDQRNIEMESFIKQQQINPQQDSINFIEIKDLNNPLVSSVVLLSQKLQGINIIQKGMVDIISNGKQAFIVSEQSSLKRCGGIGDILSGLTGLYTFWAQRAAANQNDWSKEEKMSAILHGCILSSGITRKASFKAFKNHGFSLTAPNIIECVGSVFNSTYQFYIG